MIFSRYTSKQMYFGKCTLVLNLKTNAITCFVVNNFYAQGFDTYLKH